MRKTPARQSAIPVTLAIPYALFRFTTSIPQLTNMNLLLKSHSNLNYMYCINRSYIAVVYLNSKAKQKMVTGLELLIADCTVADVNLSAKFKWFMAHVFLQVNKLYLRTSRNIVPIQIKRNYRSTTYHFVCID